jgi:hypothetical protein
MPNKKLNKILNPCRVGFIAIIAFVAFVVVTTAVTTGECQTTNQISGGSQNFMLPAILTNSVAYTPASITNVQVLSLLGVNTVYVWMFGTGTNASATGVNTVAWATSPDGVNWNTALTTTTVTASGTSFVISVTPLLVSNANYMKISWASNSDTTYGFPLNLSFVPARK